MFSEKLKEAIHNATKPIVNIEITCSEKGFTSLVRSLELWHETDKDHFISTFEGKGISFERVKKKWSTIKIYLQNSSKPVTIIVED